MSFDCKLDRFQQNKVSSSSSRAQYWTPGRPCGSCCQKMHWSSTRRKQTTPRREWSHSKERHSSVRARTLARGRSGVCYHQITNSLTRSCSIKKKKSLIQLVFKITTEKKQDHFFQASHVEEREHWVKDIKRAITCIQGGRKFARKSTRRSIRLPEKVNLRFFLFCFFSWIWFYPR